MELTIAIMVVFLVTVSVFRLCQSCAKMILQKTDEGT